MAVQYNGHVVQTETRDYDTTLPLAEVLVTYPVVYSSFQIGCIFVEYDPFNTTLIQNLIYIRFGMILTQFYIRGPRDHLIGDPHGNLIRSFSSENPIFSAETPDFHWIPKALHWRPQAFHWRASWSLGFLMKSLGSPVKSFGSLIKIRWSLQEAWGP